MPDSDAPKASEPSETAGEIRNLPVPVPPGGEPRDPNDRWFARILRAVFGWKTGSIRSDLAVVLEAGAPGETGFSPEESTMLKNILGLSERRIADVMVPRADIVAVQEDIALAELIKVFETAAHSRLVVYKETLDEPTGMVHIRDLVAYMTARATVDAAANTRRKRPSVSNLSMSTVLVYGSSSPVQRNTFSRRISAATTARSAGRATPRPSGSRTFRRSSGTTAFSHRISSA